MKLASYSHIYRIIDVASNAVPLKSIENMLGKTPTWNAVRRQGRKRKPTNNDTLANIQVPRYAYNVLAFESTRQQPPHTANKNDAIQTNNNNASIHIDDITQPTISNTQDNLIEEYSSTDEHSPQKRDKSNNLLSQDESIFLHVNTQLAREEAASAVALHSNREAAANDAHSVQNVAVQSEIAPITNKVTTATGTATTPKPRPEVIYRYPRGDRYEYLYFVNIDHVSTNKILVPDINCRHNEELNIELSLRYQCNGQQRITISGDGPRKILKLSTDQWISVHRILQVIGEFVRNMNCTDPPTESIFHRALYYLFKTSSTFSNVCINYNDGDLDMVRVLTNQYLRRYENLTDHVDRFVLSNMRRIVSDTKNDSK